MQLPIYLYGQSVLRKPAEEIGPEYPGLEDLISNMQDTLEHADGVGLAAPQVGLPIRLFIVDLRPLADQDPAFCRLIPEALLILRFGISDETEFWKRVV
jgi:peptide deformylase